MTPPADSPTNRPQSTPEDLRGRRFVVTGANSGIGQAAARAFATRGATVVLACRDVVRAGLAVNEIRRRVPGADVVIEELDLAALSSVRAFATRVLADGRAVDVLVNNAGVMALPRRETADGFEMQFGTNHLGHFALTGLLLPALLAAAAPRVVTVSSSAHKFGRIDFADLQGENDYKKWRAYGQSKLANLLFAFELGRRSAAAGLPLVSVAAHPGLSRTRLAYAGPAMDGRRWARTMHVFYGLASQSADGGARPTVLAATATDLRSGSYAGPGGPMQLWGPAQLVKAAPTAYDPVAARILWERSAELTGVTYEAFAVDDA